jgi:hypothetical protein
MQNLIGRIMPFIMAGVALVAFILGLVFLAYIFIFGAIVGLVLFAAAWIKQRFFASKKISIPKRQPRTIDHDE